jgi:hypothetical protein
MIFILGLLVTAIAVTAVVLVGIEEAADPAHAEPEDLADWERSIVARQRSAKDDAREHGGS